MVDVDYCLCGGSLGYTDETREYESWQPFIEREHHIVWRQRHPIHKHLFAYKGNVVSFVTEVMRFNQNVGLEADKEVADMLEIKWMIF